MSFEIGAAIAAGIISGTIMVAILYMGIAMMPKQMKMNLFLLLGTMAFPSGAMAIVAGAMMHAVNSILFGLAHVGIYQAFGLETQLAAWGLLFGFVHWVVVGMMLWMMPMLHIRVRSGEIEAPGAFALNYPAMTAAGFLMLHLLFGLLVGVFYQAFA